MEWELGQTVYVVPYDERGVAREGVITKIARKWMTLEPSWLGQISKEDGHVKPEPGYSPRAKAWPSKQAYEDHKRMHEKWREIYKAVQYGSYPPHMTEFDIDLIIDLINGSAKNADS